MDDFISLGHERQKTEEFDVLKLTAEPKQKEKSKPAETSTINVEKTTKSPVKPFYPRCKRFLTRAPFKTVPSAVSTTPTVVSEKIASKCEVKTEKDAPKCTVKNDEKYSPKRTIQSPKADRKTNGHSPALPKSASSVAQISLQELMSVEDKEEPPPAKKRAATADSDERLVRLRNMLKQAEVEKVTLQGYVADLQAKLAAVPKKSSTKCGESQTDENGVKCPTCNGRVEPQVLIQSFGNDFTYDTNVNKFVQISSGYYYDPYTQLFHCQENNIQYYWDTTNNVYHYHSKLLPLVEGDTVSKAAEEEEEEGELTDDQNTVSEELKDAASAALKESGVEFIASMNMYFNKNTGLYYCQSSGLYYDTKMSVFYTLRDGKYTYHSSAKPDDTKSAFAKTCIRAIVKETSCHKVKPGLLYMFTCMGGSIGREGNHVAVFPEIRVSKRHATVSYCTGKYYIMDEGTMNGTFLNGKRLSVQKVISERFELSHLDELRIGSTTLQLHIHANHDTCKWCEPGLNLPETEKPVATTISEPPTLYKQRNKETNRLKRKYKLMGSG